MTRTIWLLAAIALALSASALVLADRLPLGIAGEWQWGTTNTPLYLPGWLMAGVVASGYIVFVGVGASRIERGAALVRRGWLAAMVPAAFVVQVAMQQPGTGLVTLAKWPFVLYFSGSSGYYTAAKAEVRDAREFLANYAEFQSRQGPLHLGTHPPGLILLHHAALDLCESQPWLTRGLIATEPDSVRRDFRALAAGAALPPVDEVSLWLVALVSQFASVLVVIPAYALARRAAGPAAAWLAVALWPLVPAVTIFMPKSDVLYPLFAATTVALALGGSSTPARIGHSFVAGLVLCAGMFLSFGLIAVVPLLAIALVTLDLNGGVRAGVTSMTARIAGMAAGIALPVAILHAATGHNLIATWIACYHKHASFYRLMRRSYWPWVGFNLAEFAVTLGLPLFVAAVAGTIALVIRRGGDPAESGGARLSESSLGSSRGRSGLAVVAAWWITLIALDLSGKNLAEVARLWMFLMPFATIAAAAALEQLQPRRWPALALVAAQAIQTLAFVSSVQGFIDPASVKLP